MKSYIIADPWKIIEDKFDPHLHPNSESLMSLGNGRMGQRANFEETYSGTSLAGNYLAGVYYPDKTRVGWWKNGYPEYFAKVLNSVNWIKLKLFIDGEEIDLAVTEIKNFYRALDMKKGTLTRTVEIKTKTNKTILLHSERFYNIVDLETCYLQYSISCLDNDIEVSIESALDFNVRNADANYDDDFWTDRRQGFEEDKAWVSASTRKTDFKVCAASISKVSVSDLRSWTEEKYVDSGIVNQKFSGNLSASIKMTLTKTVAIVSSFYHPKEKVEAIALAKARSMESSFEKAKGDHALAWERRWTESDIKIEGDIPAQQGIRFNIFQLFQTYYGEDERLNIGPKGFTGEKYGGSTYWDTEAYCLPFYMGTTKAPVARNLLVYRYNHLQKAIENAEKLGFSKGAALYPMVTINGEECHNEWEITFEEIHRNGAIAYAIYDYIRYTGDQDYMQAHGLEVLIAISRFWSQRVHLSPTLNKYVMMGVTGPNEYENNVDNNWYTSYIARWCLTYTAENIEWIKATHPDKWSELSKKIKFESTESDRWKDVTNRIYLGYDADRDIFIQHDGYLNKENITVSDLKDSDRPLNQKWSWDRILRSPFIKQADVLQGIYFFEDKFSTRTIQNNFDYYEPRTVHESSLSPCVHAILAASLGMKAKAYEMYLRTARLDLDNYNNDTEDGCHITSMAGTWMSIIIGFAGMRIRDNHLIFNPFVPDQWDGYSFKINYRSALLEVIITKENIVVTNHSDRTIPMELFARTFDLKPRQSVTNPIIKKEK